MVATVRVRSKDERLTLGVQKAVAYAEGEFDPALLATPSNGNGGNGTRNREQGTGPRATPTPSSLRIVLEETDDHEGDQERLRSLVNALQGFAGEGLVQLSIRQRDGEEVQMELPRARYCPELERALSDIVGPWGTVG